MEKPLLRGHSPNKRENKTKLFIFQVVYINIYVDTVLLGIFHSCSVLPESEFLQPDVLISHASHSHQLGPPWKSENGLQHLEALIQLLEVQQDPQGYLT